ncbi:MAG: hypothetical protein AAGI48_03915 [Verrucomicrobiota bacterium]
MTLYRVTWTNPLDQERSERFEPTKALAETAARELNREDEIKDAKAEPVEIPTTGREALAEWMNTHYCY